MRQKRCSTKKRKQTLKLHEKRKWELKLAKQMSKLAKQLKTG